MTAELSVPRSLSTRVWDPKSPSHGQDFEAVIGLHREGRATLGHLPYAAFEAAGNKGQLVLGLIDGEIAGYVLFSTPRQHLIRLVHVCVGDSARRSGLARAMVNKVIDLNPARTMITAHCRVDYGLDDFWRSLDMAPAGQRPGRAKAGSTLTIWTRSIGQLDLFESALYDSTKPKAVLDSNVIIDLYCSSALERPEREESLGLEADWLIDEVELTISPEVASDIDRLQPESERDRVREALNGLVTLRREGGMRGLASELLRRMPERLTTGDASLADDVKHLADAILAGAEFFVTRDSNLIAACETWIEAEFGTEVLRPVDLIQRLMPPAPPFRFRSEQLEAVGLQWEKVASLSSRLEEAFVERTSSEKGKAFRRRLQAILAKPSEFGLQVLVDERSRLWALLATEQRGATLLVPILRVGSGSLGETIAFQLVRHLRWRALEQGADSISITDQALSPALRSALHADGFTGQVPRVKLSWLASPDAAARAITATEVSEYERINWPQVLLARDIPVHIVPIQPKYARELIGYNDTLFNTREKRALGFARQVVYFAAPKGVQEVPSRVLWYVSWDPKGHKASAVRAVVAHSRVVEATTLPVETAIEQYRAIGTLRTREIEAHSKNGKVAVWRVEDTQLLERPIDRATLDRILRKHDVTTSKITARRATPGVFDDIMRMQPRWAER